MYNLFLGFIWAFMISVFAIPSIIYVAHVKNLLDEPNKRTVHEILTPRLGGLAIFAGFMSALTIFGSMEHGVQQLVAGCIILFFVGLKDDVVSVSAFKKFFVQVLATGIVIITADIRITSFQGFLGIGELDIGISYAFTFLTIVGITNAINLIDGLDGLAGLLVLIIVCSFGTYFFLYGGEQYGPYAMVSVALAGGVVGFLRFNIHKAMVFMGDTGSLVSGFIVAILAIQFIEMNAVGSAPAMSLGILFVPLFDTVRIFSKRIVNGKSPFAPDKNHVHHILLRNGFNQIGTICLLAAINLLVTLVMAYCSDMGNWVLILILLGFALVFSIGLELLDRRLKPSLP